MSLRLRSSSALLCMLTLLLLPLGCNKKGLIFVPDIEPPPSQRLTVTVLPVELGESVAANPLLLAEIQQSLEKGEDWDGYRQELADSYAKELALATKWNASSKDAATGAAAKKALSQAETDKIGESIRSIAQGMIKEAITQSGFLAQVSSMDDIVDSAGGEIVRNLREEYFKLMQLPQEIIKIAELRKKSDDAEAQAKTATDVRTQGNLKRLARRIEAELDAKEKICEKLIGLHEINKARLMEYQAGMALLQAAMKTPANKAKDGTIVEPIGITSLSLKPHHCAKDATAKPDLDTNITELAKVIKNTIDGMQFHYTSPKTELDGDQRRKILRHLGNLYTYSRPVDKAYRNANVSVRLELEKVTDQTLASVSVASPQGGGAAGGHKGTEVTAVVAYIDLNVILPGPGAASRDEVYSRSAPIMFISDKQAAGSVLGIFSFKTQVGRSVYDTRQGLRSAFSKLRQTLLLQSEELMWTASIKTRPNRAPTPVDPLARRAIEESCEFAETGFTRKPRIDPKGYARVMIGEQFATYYTSYAGYQQGDYIDREQFLKLVGKPRLFLVRHNYTNYFRATLVDIGADSLTFRLDPLHDECELQTVPMATGKEGQIVGLVPSSNAALVLEGSALSETPLFTLSALENDPLYTSLKGAGCKFEHLGLQPGASINLENYWVHRDVTAKEGCFMDLNGFKENVHYFEDGKPLRTYLRRYETDHLPDSFLERGWEVVFDYRGLRDKLSQTDLGGKGNKK